MNHLRVEARKALGVAVLAAVAAFGKEARESVDDLAAGVLPALEVGLIALVLMGIVPFLTRVASRWNAGRPWSDEPVSDERD